MSRSSWQNRVTGCALACVAIGAPAPAFSTQVDIPGPPNSVMFGAKVVALPNGNFVVVDPQYSDPLPFGGWIASVGAVYLYRPDGQLISTLKGSNTGDVAGGNGIVVLANGNFLVLSMIGLPSHQRGAVTLVDGESGLDGYLTEQNSLIGEYPAEDHIGNGGVFALANGNYVVASPDWNNGTGAVTWGDGHVGVVGYVNAANSLIGAAPGDGVGTPLPANNGAMDWGVMPLCNGNYIVKSHQWNSNRGAVTWASGVSGITGVVSTQNSLVGSTPGDSIGYGPIYTTAGITALNNCNAVIDSPNWSNAGAAQAGAVTWFDGGHGTVGAVSAQNSLVGTVAGDAVGLDGVVALSNGNYVVASSAWSNGATAHVGAITWANGATGISGPVTPANSLVGTSAGDQIGVRDFYSGPPFFNVYALTNGNYVVNSTAWTNGTAAAVGAVTWANGASGLVGTVSVANSFLGVANAIAPLTNGNYVIGSTAWSGTAPSAGAATLADGTHATAGTATSANSLVGTYQEEFVGSSLFALSNGNYVVSSFSSTSESAITWGDGTLGVHGAVSNANSTIASSAPSATPTLWAAPLQNGNYVIWNSLWGENGAHELGALMLANGRGPTTVVPSAANSLVGSQAGDLVGGGGTAGALVSSYPGNVYVIFSPKWAKGSVAAAGAVTLASSTKRLVGPVTSDNSVVGTLANEGPTMVFDYSPKNHQLIVGKYPENSVTLFQMEEIFAGNFGPELP